MKKILFMILLLLSVSAQAQDAVFETQARQAIAIDFDTGAVLMEKNADERMPTSSMSKVMSMYMVFEALKEGKLSLSDKLPVSERAWRMQGSKMFVELNSQIPVEDLIRGVIVQSGNDATIVLAEGVSGSEEAFAAAMTSKAKELGMNASNFTNASGWPDEQHYSTARDLAVLGRALIFDFPNLYPYYSELEYTYHGIKQGNRNPLLYNGRGGDGIKTGHTEAAGYGLIGSGHLNGRRVVFALNGLPDMEARASESARLLQWGLNHFENKTLFKGQVPVTEVAVALGGIRSVNLVPAQDVLVTLPRAGAKDMLVTAHFKEPLLAPLDKTQAAGYLEISIPQQPPLKIDLFPAQDVLRAGFFQRGWDKLKILLGMGNG